MSTVFTYLQNRTYHVAVNIIDLDINNIDIRFRYRLKRQRVIYRSG